MLGFWGLLLLVQFTGLMGITKFDEDVDDDQSCLPRLADSCFNDIGRNLECHLHPSAPYNCPLRDIGQLCSAIQDGLNCASDIIDTDCSKEEGREKFDSWMRGLKAVYYSLCSTNSYLLPKLLQDPKCWNSLMFLNCVERDIEVSHVVDLLKKQLNSLMCNHFLIAMTTCNVLATSPEPGCARSQGVIREVLHTFFTQSACGAACLQLADMTGDATAVASPKWIPLSLAAYYAVMRLIL